jgi:hypothetical protein
VSAPVPGPRGKTTWMGSHEAEQLVREAGLLPVKIQMARVDRIGHLTSQVVNMGLP